MADDTNKPEEARPEPEKTGKDLLAYLEETGTGPGRLELLKAYLKQQPKATAAEALGYLTHAGCQPGTITKAGKWVTGREDFTYRDPSLPDLTPDEELKQLRQRVAELAGQNRLLEANNHRLTQRLAKLQGASLREPAEPAAPRRKQLAGAAN